MTETTKAPNPQVLRAGHGDLAGARAWASPGAAFARKGRHALFLLFVSATLAGPQMAARSQTLPYANDAPGTGATADTRQLDLDYIRPTPNMAANNYFSDAFGPYPIAGAAIEAGLDQARSVPPEWKQGFTGYTKRLGSDFGMMAVGTTTRYALAGVLKEDTQYYRCECSGTFPRFRHAVLATVTARRGSNGHRVFSIPALVAPYSGSFTAVYGWYPSRYGAQDAFRMGNYSLLTSVGGNIALEFLYGGRNSLLSRIHLRHAHSAPDPGPHQ